MEAPPGFAAASRFSGFQHDSGSMVSVVELATGYESLIAQLTDPAFAAQGIVVESREELSTPDGAPATLIRGSQTGEIEFAKAILISGSRDLAAIVTATVPAQERELIASVLRALRTVRVDPDLTVDPLLTLSFELSPAPPLLLANVINGVAVYNVSGQPVSADPLEPLLVVGPSLGVVPIESIESFARTRLQQTALVDVREIDELRAVTIGGLDGVEIVASGAHESGESVVLYQVLLVDEIGYALISGRCREAERVACLAMMRASASTFAYTSG
jgi:hypothetical protein